MQMLAKAIALAAKWFEEKTDKSDKPYILHCLRVMNGVNQNDEELMCAAVLHDCIEDLPFVNEDTLRQYGFSKRIISTISILTHKKDVPYMEYIKNIALNKDAREIKLADLKDNSDITRLKGLRKKDFDRMEKYHQAWVYLSN